MRLTANSLNFPVFTVRGPLRPVRPYKITLIHLGIPGHQGASGLNMNYINSARRQGGTEAMF